MDKTRHELFLDGLIASWKAILGLIACGDSSAARQKLASPVLAFLEEQISDFGYTPVRATADVVSTETYMAQVEAKVATEAPVVATEAPKVAKLPRRK